MARASITAPPATAPLPRQKLAVVGGGNSAVQEALFLTRFATHIDLLVRSKLRASDVLQKDLDKAVQEGKITVHLATPTEEILGSPEGGVTSVKGGGKEFAVDGVFVFVGLVPNSQFVHGSGVLCDEIGFVLTDANCRPTSPACLQRAISALAPPCRLLQPPERAPQPHLRCGNI